MHSARWLAVLAAGACTLAACGDDAPEPFTVAQGLPRPDYVPGAATARAAFRDEQLRGRATVVFTNDAPRSCQSRSRGRALTFGLRVGPEQIGSGRSEDKVRLSTGAIGRRAGSPGYEAPVAGQDVEIGGVGRLVPGAGGTVRFAGDLRSGVATLGSGDAAVTITFRC